LCGLPIEHGDVVVQRAGKYKTNPEAFHVECLTHAAKIADPEKEIARLRDELVNSKERED
jgi:hypothetical protein